MTTPADRIRASVEALPEYLRERPWKSFNDQVYIDFNGNDHVFAWVDGRQPSGQGEGEMTAHIALLASPPVATALADLLDAMPGSAVQLWEWDRVLAARGALEALLTKPADATEEPS